MDNFDLKGIVNSFEIQDLEPSLGPKGKLRIKYDFAEIIEQNPSEVRQCFQ